MISGRSRSISFTPAAANTNSDSRRCRRPGTGHANQGVHVLDAVLGQARLVGLLRRRSCKALAGASAQALAQKPRSLSLAVMTAMRQPARWKAGKQRLDPQELRVVHHHLFPRLGVEEVVAANAVHGRRLAGDDGEVVGIGEAGHDAVGQQAGALGKHLAEPRRAPASTARPI
jgi:hypothetical protein